VVTELSGADEGIPATLEAILAEAFEQELIEDAALAGSIEQGKAFMHLRYALSEVQGYEGGSIKDDVSVPVAQVPDFIAEASEVATKLIPGSRPVPFGHLGDGNIHFNVSQPVGADKAAFLARWKEMNAAVHAIVHKHGGSISAEHGIGQLKRALLPGVKDPVALEIMRAIKGTLDPKGILNPGKML
jgi:FAD/FMN-containing dehydrogenase